MVYKVSSCFFFYYGDFFLFLIVAQLELSHGVVGPRSLVEGQHVWSYRA